MNLNASLKRTPIAVVGVSALFADAINVEEFWTNIVQSKDSISDVPDSRWAIDEYYDPDPTTPDKSYCKRGGFIPDLDFNPMEFGLPPNILEVTDASQLLALVAARDALVDAGYAPKSEAFTVALREKTGVLLGVGGGQKLITPLIARLQYPVWEKALRTSGIAEADIPPIIDKMKKAYVGWNENSFPGLLGNVISGRITNRFDLGGINSVVDAACAASLSAVKMSLSELVEGRADMMLTGGVDTDNSPFMYMCFSKTPAFSKSGNISPFSDQADGMLIGEGVGIMVLKRLADAERDGDRIYAKITGVGTSSDGRFKSVYAPRSSGQALAMNRAYDDAGYAPETVGLIEAHGTGTGAGDPTEFASMQMVFDQKDGVPRTALGSVKSQIGHTKAAAGAAGMIKAILALHHKVLPGTINVEKPNSKFDIKDSSIYINTQTRPWFRNGHPRRAGVSAFGFGGINVHVAMEEYTGKQYPNQKLHQPFKAVLLQSASPQSLLQEAQQLLQSWQHDAQAFQTYQNPKVEAEQARLGFVATNADQGIAMLQTAVKTLSANTQAWNHPKGIYFHPTGIPADQAKVVALFSGQGSQYVNMGSELAISFPEIRAAFEQVDQIAKERQETPLTKVVYPIPAFEEAKLQAQKTELTKTINAQPAIGTLSMGMYKLLHRAGLRPSFAAGHSFGELTALWAAGVFDDATFLRLAKARGYAMSAPANGRDTGRMLAVQAAVQQVSEAISRMEGVKVANVNAPHQVVIGGASAAIDQAAQQLQAQGFVVKPLKVSAAFHTDLVSHAQQPFADFVQGQAFNTPGFPVYANATAKPYPANSTDIKQTLQNQILNPVYFQQEIEQIHQDGGRIFIEFGPRGVLTSLVSDVLKGKEHVAIALNSSSRGNSEQLFRQAIVQLQVLGISLDEVDPYFRGYTQGTKRTKMNVSVSGANYVSPATRKAYVDVLDNDFTIQAAKPQIIEKPIEVEKIVEVERIVEVPVEVPTPISQTSNHQEDMNKETLELFKATLQHFENQQNKSADLFERLINEQNQQNRQLLQMLAEQLEEAGNGSQKAPSVAQTAAQQTVEAKRTEQPKPVQISTNGNGNGHRNGFHKPAAQAPAAPQQQTAQPTATATPAAPAAGLDTGKLQKILLDVVSEKTGYPAEMLEMNMDLEADLGIDSIKRVEIFGALTAQYPEMSGINPNELTELRTLAEIVSYVSKTASVNPTVAVQESAPAATSTATAPEAPATDAAGTDNSQLQKILLDVVSEKTGYPAEMLEMNMDLEADLGIDSIKRVEIFGALTAQYPEMSGINPNELTELRTLAEIVSYVGKQQAQVS